MPSELLSLHKNKLTTGKMIDDNFREISVKNHLEGMNKLVEGSNWEKPTKLNIAKNLVEKIGELLETYVGGMPITQNIRKLWTKYDV